MFSEKLIFWLHKIPDWGVFIVASGLIGASVHFFFPHPLILVVLFLPILLAFEAVSRSSRFVAVSYSSQAKITFFAVLFMVVLAGLLASENGSIFELRDIAGHSVLSFSIVGAVLGLAVTDCWRRLTLFALLGRRRLTQIILMNFLWGLLIVFCPRGPHVKSAPFFICGIAIGVMLHKGSRMRLTQAAAAYRRLEDIADAWPPNEEATPIEQECLRLLAHGRQLPYMKFRKLRRVLDRAKLDSRLAKNERLSLVSASVFRLEGEYDRAIAEASIVSGPPTKVVEAHLLLLKYMSLQELGHPDEASTELQKVLASDVGKNCPLANALSALLLAEKVLGNKSIIISTKEPLLQMLRSMDLRGNILKRRKEEAQEDGGDSINRFFGRFLEIGVPIGASLSLDILGYCHLAGGYTEEAALLLERCVNIDPAFSPAYVHLGDLFLLRNRLAYNSSPSPSDVWHASACYRAALLIERSDSGRIHRYAEERLLQIERITGGDSLPLEQPIEDRPL